MNQQSVTDVYFSLKELFDHISFENATGNVLTANGGRYHDIVS